MRTETLLTAVGLGLMCAAAACAKREGGTAAKRPEGEKWMGKKIELPDEEWKARLSPEAYRITRQKGTERAFTGKYNKHYANGAYHCVACGLELFKSDHKYDSHSGWPSFRQPAGAGHVTEESDHSVGMRRTEVLCSRCDAHLGHVFEDGPKPTGRRYCINSASLDFKPADRPAGRATATFGSGCFWCTEAVFERLDGVLDVRVGYTGGQTKNPTYQDVCSGRTGHAEAAEITYDPDRITYDALLAVFWRSHDPTTLNRQGGDVGAQYRSAVFYHDEEQKRAAEASKAAEQKKLGRPVVTEVVPAGGFYKAEVSHQDYFRNNPNAPYCRMVIAPKLKKLDRK